MSYKCADYLENDDWFSIQLCPSFSPLDIRHFILHFRGIKSYTDYFQHDQIMNFSYLSIFYYRNDVGRN